MKVVLFACIHNAGRSQMAAAFFTEMADAGRAQAVSAGTTPAAAVHPEVVAAMREVGIELGDVKPRSFATMPPQFVDVLVTMGCGDDCPVIPRVRSENWELEDPKGKSPERVRAIRDDIRGRVEKLVAAEGWQRRR